jgi:hypothetical protein
LTRRANGDTTLTHILAAAFFLVSTFFVWRSFHGMRIGNIVEEPAPSPSVAKSVAGD